MSAPRPIGSACLRLIGTIFSGRSRLGHLGKRARVEPRRHRSKRQRASVVALLTTCFGVAPLLGAGASGVPTAVSFTGTPAIGALFSVTRSGALGSHFCSGAVVRSPSGNLVLTTAHCVARRLPSRIAFVPGYENKKSPFGIWRVFAVTTVPTWAASSDPEDDVAFLSVHIRNPTAKVQRLTGGERLGVNQPVGQRVTVIGYPNSSDAPIRCANTIRSFSATELQFACNGYTAGTSGGPILAGVNLATGRGVVIGVIGGYEQGGTSPSVSYAAKFRANIRDLFTAANS